MPLAPLHCPYSCMRHDTNRSPNHCRDSFAPPHPAPYASLCHRATVLCIALLGTLLPQPTLAEHRADAFAALDYVYADSESQEQGAGSPEKLVSHQMGMHLNSHVLLYSDTVLFSFDYRGREHISGDISNSANRLLYEAKFSYAFFNKSLILSLGRWVEHGSVFLPIDGLGLVWKLPQHLQLRAFVGRRGITTSRENIPWNSFLPATGLNLQWSPTQGQAGLSLTYAQDRVTLLVGDTGAEEDYGAVYLLAYTNWKLIDQLRIGGQAAIIQQGQFILGPTWGDVQIEAEVNNLWSLVFYTHYRPMKTLRLDYQLHFQRPGIFRARTIYNNETTDEVVDPNFLDNRLRGAWSPWNLGWLRWSIRHRLRPQRHELRYAISAHATRLGLKGLGIKARLMYEQIALEDADSPQVGQPDRLMWLGELTYRNYGFNISSGVSFVERQSGAHSARRSGADPGEDLHPFVLAAQKIVYFRSFYEHHYWFLGLNAEHNLSQAEWRVMLQSGAIWDQQW